MFKHVVAIVTEAWNNDDVDPKEAAERACQFMHHPYFAQDDNEFHTMMMDYVKLWLERQGEEREEVLSRLTKEGVVNQKNNTEGLKYGSTINVEIEKSKASKVASLGLFGVIALAFKKTFPFCFSSSNTQDATGRKSDFRKLQSQ